MMTSVTTTSENLPNGLINLGNTCYANAALQCIATIFGDYFSSGEYASDVGNFSNSEINVIQTEEKVVGYLKRYMEWLQKREKLTFPDASGEIKDWSDEEVCDRGIDLFCSNFASLITSINNPYGLWKQEHTNEYLKKFIFLVKLFKKSDDFFDGNQHDSNDLLAFILELLSNCMSFEVSIKISAHQLDLDTDDIKTLSRKDKSRLASYKAWQDEWALRGEGQPTYRISNIAERLYGQQKTFIICGHEDCDNTSEKFDSFSILSLPINNSNTLEQCLDDYMKVEVLDGDNMWYCDKCKRKSRATKQLTLWKTGDYMVVHLKRFTSIYNRLTFSIQTTKSDRNVKFPLENLDLSSYVEEKNERGEIFDLVAMVIHYGSIDHGHYICFRKIDDQWYVFNDANVRKMAKIDTMLNGSVYYVIYKRR